jgi:hypothetical protein
VRGVLAARGFSVPFRNFRSACAAALWLWFPLFCAVVVPGGGSGPPFVHGYPMGFQLGPG